jgi:hypothetical protein
MELNIFGRVKEFFRDCRKVEIIYDLWKSGNYLWFMIYEKVEIICDLWFMKKWKLFMIYENI